MMIFDKPSKARDAYAGASREGLLAHLLKMASTLFYRPILCDEPKRNQTSCTEKRVLSALVVVYCQSEVAKQT